MFIPLAACILTRICLDHHDVYSLNHSQTVSDILESRIDELKLEGVSSRQHIRLLMVGFWVSAGTQGETKRGQRRCFLSAFILRFKDKCNKRMRTMLLIESKLRPEGGWRFEVNDYDEKTIVNTEASGA